MEDNIIEGVIKAIAKELKKLFPKIKIYDEDVEQGYKEPCFFVIWENDDEKKLVGNRYDFEHHFRIIYFQDFKEKDANNKIYSIRGKLQTEFCCVENEGIYYRVIDKHFEKQDKDLYFTFKIKCQLKKYIEDIKIGQLENLTEEGKD